MRKVSLRLSIYIMVFNLLTIGCDDGTVSPMRAGETVGEIRPDQGEVGGEVGGERGGGQEVEAGTFLPPREAVVLKIDPRDSVLIVREGTEPPSESFQLSLVKESGEVLIPAEDALWRASPGNLGAVIGGQFVSNRTAGEVQIFAEYQDEISGEALVAVANVMITAPQDIILDGVNPEDVMRFDQVEESEGCASLSFTYPEPFTTIPLNLQGFTFQWNLAGSTGPFMITAQAGDTQMRWFTGDQQLTPTGIAWESAKVSGPNGLSTWRISYLTPEGQRCDGTSLSIIADQSQLVGAVYYWSTTDSGIMRLAAGETEPEPLLTPQTAPEISCPACHALSRDGTRIAFTRTTFPPFGELAISSTLTPRTLNYDPAGTIGYFPSFSPDPNVLIAGNGGRLVIMDSNNGMEIESLTLPSNTVGGSPDWSWQGDRITATVGPSGLENPLPDVGISSGSIYEWVQSGESWGAPNEIITPQDNTWHTNPAYSPEGSFIAYNVEGNHPNMNEEGMGNPNIDLWIKRVGDASPPVRLDKANRGSMQGNSWPKWSPHDRRGKVWLAFSSLRDYGHLLRQGSRQTPLPQIWVTAIDLDAPVGQDPSSPAFWLPYQSLNSGNHIPYWAPYEKR